MKTFIVTIFLEITLNAQVSNIIRYEYSYKKLAYEGSKFLQVDKANSPNSEDNVFVFSNNFQELPEKFKMES